MWATLEQWRVPAHPESREDGCSQNGLISWLFSWLWFSLCNSWCKNWTLPFLHLLATSSSARAANLSPDLSRPICPTVTTLNRHINDLKVKKISMWKHLWKRNALHLFLLDKTALVQIGQHCNVHTWGTLFIRSWPVWICPCETGCSGPLALSATVPAGTARWWHRETLSASCQSSAGAVWPSQLSNADNFLLNMQQQIKLSCHLSSLHQLVVELLNSTCCSLIAA